MCAALVVGNTIGIGIFLLPAALAPYGFNALTGWALTAAGCLILARVFAGLARALPSADGAFGYLRATLGEPAAFVAVWCYWVSVWSANAVIATGVVAYLQAAVPQAHALPAPAIAIGVLWLFVLVNLLGVRAGGRVQMVTAALKLLPMAAVIGLGAWILVSHPADYGQHMPTTPLTLPRTTAAATLALFAMLGLECAAVPASRVRDPGRTIPRATLAGTAATAAIYVAISAIPLLLIPQADLARSQAPFADLLGRYLGHDYGRLLAAFVAVSGLGALNGWTLLVGELTRSMAANGALPAPLARVNARGAPAAALVLTAALATALVLMNYSRSLVEAFAFLINVVTAANLPLYLFASAGLAVLWKRTGRGAALAFGLAGAGYCLFAFVGVGWEPFKWALALSAVGLPVWAVQRWRRLTAVPETALRR
jgi:APA family basic amino acid/polyamine antiporter